MDKEQLKATFDQIAGSYDQIWSKLEPFNQSLYLLMSSMMSKLPANAHVVCVGVGTCLEMIELSAHFQQWTFKALDPSEKMIQMCQDKMLKAGLSDRCRFQIGYIEDCPDTESYDGIISLLVSQFLVDQVERTEFFKAICQKLTPQGLFINTDLTGDKKSADYDYLLQSWFKILHGTAVSPEMFNAMRSAYEFDLGILAVEEVEAMLTAAGFNSSVHFFQLGMIHGWCSSR